MDWSFLLYAGAYIGYRAWMTPSNPRFLTGFNNIFLLLLQNSLRHAQRVLTQTGFAIHQRAVTDVTARKMNRSKKVVSERPFGPVRLVIGAIRGASRPFGVWECGKRAWIGITSTIPTVTFTATDSVTVSVSAPAHGPGLGPGSRSRHTVTVSVTASVTDNGHG